jgi:hypothetical protein
MLHAGGSLNPLHEFEIVFTLTCQLCCSRSDMAATLPVYIKEKQHAVIQFLCAECVPGAESHFSLSEKYGNCSEMCMGG